jgi:1,4-alpha-glucan branching enzyme
MDPRTCDVIHLHSLALSELAFELQRRTRRPLIYTAHALLWLELEPGPPADFWCAVQQRVLVSSDHVVFLSQAEQSAAIERLPALARRSSVVPNGVPSPPELAPEPPFDGNGPTVFAGRFARSKGVELLGELVPKLLAENGAPFVFAGGHGDETGERVVRELAARYPQRCRSLGWLARDDLDRLFQHAGLVVVPSRYEPCGLVALEAMRVGAPVLAACVGGLAEVVGSGSGGRLVHAHDADTWSTAAATIIGDSRTNRTLRAQGPRYVRTRFDSRRLAQRIVKEVYAA